MGTYLQKTNSSPSSQRQFTVSTWVKVCREGNDRYIWSMRVDDSNWIGFRFATNGCVILQIYDSNSTTGQLQSNAFFRDPSSWYHFTVRVNTNESTADDRLRIYVNGTQLTSFSSRTNLPSGYDIPITSNFQVATSPYSSQYNSNSLDGYLTDFNYCDNYSYAPTSFGETDSTTGEWKPKVDLTGVSYGNNGFRLQFENAGSLGADTSGQSNNLTVSGAGTNAQTTDTASNNFVTMNPLDSGTVTFAKGNCEITCTNGNKDGARGTIGVQNGKWYFEFKLISHAGGDPPQVLGVAQSDAQLSTWVSSGNYAVYEIDSGKKRINGSQSSYGATATDNDIIGVALNMDDNEVTFFKNGASQGTITSATSSGEFYFPYITDGSSSRGHTTQLNFGNPPFAIASGNADAAGHGNFEYAVPSGYFAICTKNLNTYG
tara:strand:- start:1531 stop:2823 length:1293 start_codon:yes stop_codon:yes gene_type:complete